MAEGLAGLLRWYADMGVDIALDDAPHDRFAESRAGVSARAEGRSPPAAPPEMIEAGRRVMREAATALPVEAIEAARDQAAAAQNLGDLREKLSRFEGCGLKATATRLVFGDGNPSAEIMFIGEAPGADEDREGVPFVGRAGQLLDKMLAAIGLDRGKVYIANVVPWRPPGNRTPTPLETAACLPFTRRQIELVNPKILVCLGAASAQTLLGGKDGVLRMRGRWFTYAVGGKEIQALAMLHPAYLLRQPAQKKLTWQDLLMLGKEINRLQLLAKGNGANVRPETQVTDERLRFVARLIEGEEMTVLCRVARKTSYKIYRRDKDHGLKALTGRSRRPVHRLRSKLAAAFGNRRA